MTGGGAGKGKPNGPWAGALAGGGPRGGGVQDLVGTPKSDHQLLLLVLLELLLQLEDGPTEGALAGGGPSGGAFQLLELNEGGPGMVHLAGALRTSKSGD